MGATKNIDIEQKNESSGRIKPTEVTTTKKQPLIEELTSPDERLLTEQKNQRDTKQDQYSDEELLDAKYMDDMGDSAFLTKNQINEFKEKLITRKDEASRYLSNRDFRKAAILFGMCIHYSQGKSSILFIKRAECLIEMNKYMSARRDCNRALELNPDATRAHLLRAKANIRLNNIEDVHRDLIYVEASDFPTEYEQVKKEYEEKREEERKKKVAAEINTKLKFQGADQMPSWMTPQLFEKVAKDEELLKAFQTPRLMTAIQEIASNPNAFIKYKNDPQVLQLFMKFSKIMSQ